MARTVALVTDSTAMLPRETAERRDIRVVPLQVVIGAKSYDEGVDDEATPATIAGALREWTPVSTSRPTPAVFLAAYEQAAEQGADEVLSIHLSGDMSGTFESAQLAARDAPIPVRALDTRQLGMATGFAVLAAADVLDRGGASEEAAGAASSRAGRTTSLFYVDTLEYLRRGGRIGAAAALLGSALSVKPLLTVREGVITAGERVRTGSRAVARLEELSLAALAFAAASHPRVDVAVHHLDDAEGADRLAAALRDRVRTGVEVVVAELSAVLGVHVGPGTLGVVIAPRPREGEPL